MGRAPAISKTAPTPQPQMLSELLLGVIRFDVKLLLGVIRFDIKQALNVLTFEQVWVEAFEKVFAKMLAHGTNNLYDVQ